MKCLLFIFQGIKKTRNDPYMLLINFKLGMMRIKTLLFSILSSPVKNFISLIFRYSSSRRPPHAVDLQEFPHDEDRVEHAIAYDNEPAIPIKHNKDWLKYKNIYFLNHSLTFLAL